MIRTPWNHSGGPAATSADSARKAAALAGTRALVSGAGFAGLATAFWMSRLGYRVTVVEVADGVRRGGTPVDIKEGTVDVMGRMGLLEAVRARSLPPRTTEFRSADDVPYGRLPPPPDVQGGPDEHHEIDRDELLDILLGALPTDVEIVFGRSIVQLEEGADGVTARFSDGSSRAFSIVLGCDGTRSTTRRLVFGDVEDHTPFLGVYTYLKVVPRMIIDHRTTQIFNSPGLTVMLNGYEGKTDVSLSFRTEREIVYDHRYKARQRRLVRERFEGLGWRTPELLEEVDAEGDCYFDGIYQVRMPS